MMESDYAMTFEDIARELGLSKQRVERIYSRAMSKLRRYFSIHKRRELLRELLREDPDLVAGSPHREPLYFPRDIHDWTITPVPTTRSQERTLRSVDDNFKKWRKKRTKTP